MTEAVDRCDEVVFGLCGGITHDEGIQHAVVGIGKEHGFDVGIVHTHVLHTILFLVATGQFVLLDATCHIVIGMGTDHQTILRLPVHRLRINIIMILRVLHQPPLILELLEILGSLLIHFGIVLGGAYGEVDFGFDDMIEAHLIVASLGASLFTVKHVVRTALYFKSFGGRIPLKGLIIAILL